jgi:hypothetical protein
MTADLVRLLRFQILDERNGAISGEPDAIRLCGAAADEIERLRVGIRKHYEYYRRPVLQHDADRELWALVGIESPFTVSNTLDVPAKHDPKCKPDFPFHLCPVCYPGL